MKVMGLKDKEKNKKKYRTIYNIVMMLRDKKMKKNEFVNVYVTTESGDNNLFKTWELFPESDKQKSWSKVKAK